MKLAIPGLIATALVLASPVALAQYSSGGTSTPGASVKKDDQTYKTTQPKKHSASYTHRHRAKHAGSKAQTTGSGSSSEPGASIKKDDATPKSR